MGEECTLFVRAQSRDFFSIGVLPLWVNENLPGARTETYISLDKSHLWADGRIGLSTFAEIAGRDLMVQGLIPEVYDPAFREGEARDRGDAVIGFVRKSLSRRSLSAAERSFFREFLLAFLEGKSQGMVQVLFRLFIDLEAYLRGNLETFVGRVCQQKARDAFGVARGRDRKKLSLGDVLAVYGRAIALAEIDGETDLGSGWSPFVELRNLTAHGVLELSAAEWSRPLDTVIERSWPAQRLIGLIARTTDNEFSGEYFDLDR